MHIHCLVLKNAKPKIQVNKISPQMRDLNCMTESCLTAKIENISYLVSFGNSRVSIVSTGISIDLAFFSMKKWQNLSLHELSF